MKKLIIILSLVIILASFFFSMQMQVNHSQYSAKQGYMDLSGWDPAAGDNVILTGEWEFYWKEFLTETDFAERTDRKPMIVGIPNDWNYYRLDGKNLPGEGYATYRLRVKVPESDTPLALRITSVSTAYRCYIGDTLIAEDGVISKTAEGSKPHFRSKVAVFVPPSKEFDVIIQVSNHIYARGGLWHDITFGTVDQINQYNSVLHYKDGIVIGSLAVMAAYFLIYFLILRDSKKSLMFSLMCLILILRTTLFGDYLIEQIAPDFPFHLLVWLRYLTVIWFPVALFHMMDHAVGETDPNRYHKLIDFYAIAASVLTGLFPISIYTRWSAAFLAAAVFIATAAIGRIISAVVRKVDGADVVLAGVAIASLAGIHDALYQATVIYAPLGEIRAVGLVVFMLFMTYLMADRFAKTLRSEQSLSCELADKLKLEKELTERLYALDKLKDEFLSNTSHELRTPLNGIINITHSVLNGIGGRLNYVQRQNLEAIQISAKKLDFLINDLLDVTRMHYGGIKINPVSLNIKMIIENQVFIFNHINKKGSVVLLTELPPDLPNVLADEDRLIQILNNLLGNALKFTFGGNVRISANSDGEWMHIKIADTGTGIPEDQLSDIFNAFVQIDGTIQRKHEGLGLGLYITKQLVELHGGSIRIDSKPEEGTQVCFSLPLDRGKKESASANRPAALISESAETDELLLEKGIKKYNILAVDDDQYNLRALKNILQLAGYQVKCVKTGAETMEILKDGISVDLVILDIMMPEMSGYDVLEQMRQKYNMVELPVLMLTAKVQKEDVSLCFQLGANDFLEKPFEADELTARVNSLVKLKNAVAQLVAAELSFLQAQIKPHFIHNALGVIASLSTKNPERTKELILDLSDYLRGSFDQSGSQGLTTLTKEIELVRAYLSLEQERFRERLKVSFYIADNSDCTIPLLTIQPLVENAIRHGVMHKKEGGEIHVSVSRENSRIKIEVRDNGVGIPKDVMDDLFKLERDQRGVGIANIHRRLIALYGDGLHIESNAKDGSAIYFYIPYRPAEENKQNEDFDR